MHPSMWLMIKGTKPLEEVKMAQPVPENKFAETHTCIKRQSKGLIALFVDDMIQAGAKASNIELLKTREKKWTMSKPEHLGPLDRNEKLKSI
eukprot:12935175-Prorocentrum_lima.AAC.1